MATGITPTFSMLEKANRRFRPCWRIKNRLAAKTVNVPAQIVISVAILAWGAALTISDTRQMANKAQLSREPDNRADEGAGASEWASGSQLCRGNIPAFGAITKQTKNKTKAEQFVIKIGRNLYQLIGFQCATGYGAMLSGGKNKEGAEQGTGHADAANNRDGYFRVASRAFFVRF